MNKHQKNAMGDPISPYQPVKTPRVEIKPKPAPWPVGPKKLDRPKKKV